jgi:antirestriction protein ArdC
VLLLWMAQGAYSSPRWLTFKKALDLGSNAQRQKSPAPSSGVAAGQR